VSVDIAGTPFMDLAVSIMGDMATVTGGS